MTSPIIAPLPNNILDGQLADAGPVMSNFNHIVQQVNSNASSGGGSTSSTHNFLYNGAMIVTQRFGTFSTQLSAAAGYTVDRWQGKTGAGSSGLFVQAGAIANATFQYACRVQRINGVTAVTALQLAQSLESTDSFPMQGQSVTLSFYARAGANYSPSSSVLVSAVMTGTGTDENVLTGYTGSATAFTQNNTLTTSWQRFSVNGTIASTATEVGVIFTMNPVGTAGAADSFDITGVQLEIGSSASAFAVATFANQLAGCLRYYQKSFPYATIPTSAGNTTGAVEYAVLVAGATQTVVHIGFNQHMRVAPTLTTWNPGALGGNWRNVTAGANSGAPTAVVTEWGISLTNPQVGGDSIGQLCYVHWSADAEL